MEEDTEKQTAVGGWFGGGGGGGGRVGVGPEPDGAPAVVKGRAAYGRYEVELEGGALVSAFVSGDRRRPLSVGDRVLVERSPYDLTQGRILRRLR